MGEAAGSALILPLPFDAELANEGAQGNINLAMTDGSDVYCNMSKW